MLGYRVKISQLATPQHGNVSRGQLLALGLSRAAISRQISSGHLIVVYAGVYAVGHREPGPIPQSSAAVLACGPGAALSRDSAAALWGLGRWPALPEVSSPQQRARPGISTHRTSTLTPDDVTVHHGVPVTAPVRTICDVARRCTDDQLLQAVDDARLHGYLGAAAFAELLRRCPRLHRLVGEAPSRSELEREWRRFAARYAFPPHRCNVQLHGYEVDVFFDAHHLAVELDGWHFHRGPHSFRADRVRDTVLKEHGIDTVRLTSDRLTRSEAVRLLRILDRQLR